MAEEYCVWAAETKSSRAWFEPLSHPEEDSVHRSIRGLWSYCPYCGRPIHFTDSGAGEHRG